MTRRRTDFRPDDFVRCARCNRLSLKKTSVQIAGYWYGSDCKQYAFSSANEAARDQRGKTSEQ